MKEKDRKLYRIKWDKHINHFNIIILPDSIEEAEVGGNYPPPPFPPEWYSSFQCYAFDRAKEQLKEIFEDETKDNK